MTPLQKKLLHEVDKIRPGATLCAGQLARKCETTLAEARADLIDLAMQKKITICQGGVVSPDPQKLRGPFRVRI